jgi:peptidoglycan L-alanyl-D-glutamate endopeptidase CwlK
MGGERNKMTYSLSERSLKNLEGVHPKLVAVVKEAIQITTQDFMVIEGVRTQARQDELWAQGRTKPGPVVTWVKEVASHGVHKDGYGYAVDLCPYPVDWNDLSKFDAIAKAMFQAGANLDVLLRWGADWNRNGKPRERGESDSPHFELA